MFGNPVSRVAQSVGEPRQIERIVQGDGPRRGRGHWRQVEDGERDQPSSSRIVSGSGGPQRPTLPKSAPPQPSSIPERGHHSPVLAAGP